MERISSNDASSMDALLSKLKRINDSKKIQNQQNKNNPISSGTKKKLKLTTYMIRLANARTTIEVDGVIRTVQAEARAVKSSGGTSQEATAANRVARKVREKGTIKIYRLRKEERIKLLSDMQKNSNNINKSEELLKILASKKRNRKAEERNDIINAMKSDKYEDAYNASQTQGNMNTVDMGIAASVEIAGIETSLMEYGFDEGGMDFLL